MIAGGAETLVGPRQVVTDSTATAHLGVRTLVEISAKTEKHPINRGDQLHNSSSHWPKRNNK